MVPCCWNRCQQAQVATSDRPIVALVYGDVVLLIENAFGKEMTWGCSCAGSEWFGSLCSWLWFCTATRVMQHTGFSYCQKDTWVLWCHLLPHLLFLHWRHCYADNRKVTTSHNVSRLFTLYSALIKLHLRGNALLIRSFLHNASEQPIKLEHSVMLLVSEVQSVAQILHKCH